MNNMIWRIKLVKPVKKQKSQTTSTSIELPKTVVVSVGTVNESETQNLGKEIENLLASGRTNTATIIKSNSTRIAESNTEQIESEYSPTKKHININENNSLLMPMEENVSAVEKKTLSSLPLTTSKVAEDNTESQSKTTTSISTSKSTDTQKTDIDCSAQTATSQWVCMDIARILKVSFESKEYDFIELSDGSLVWNENLEPYRKQQKLNVAENVLKYGTGGINIDESRVRYEPDDLKEAQKKRDSFKNSKDGYQDEFVGGKADDFKNELNATGRFPANLIHDNSEEVRECFPETKDGGSRENTQRGQIFVHGGKHESFGGEGNASRYFKSIIYQAKASKSERNKGCEELEEKQYSHDGRDKEIENPYQRNKSVATNNHPTVKPIALMEYLINMVTPKGGIVLDPFAGSGTTGVACKNINRNYILIEKEPEYVEIIKKRLAE